VSIGATLLVVALGAALFVSLGGRQGSGATTTVAATATTPPAPTATVPAVVPPAKGNLPAGVEVTDFVPTGPDAGWATGELGIDPTTGFPARSVVLRYTGGSCTQIGPALDGARLSGLAMLGDGDGWALGVDDSSHGVMLRISNAGWQRAVMPAAAQGGLSAGMWMRSSDDGWLAIANPKGAHTGASTSLMHYTAGSWSPVATPLHWINDLAPVGPDEAWVVGRLASGASEAIHVSSGTATVALTTPGATDLYDLRAVSASDIWADGARHAPDNNDAEDTPVVYHYDGSSWQPVDLHAAVGVQRIQVTGDGTAWGEASANPPLTRGTQAPATEVHALYTLRSGQWARVSLPYPDLTALTPVPGSSVSSTDDLWALGSYMVITQVTNNSYTGVGHTVLLHFASGRWTAYGR
jgi:hypothetical protein